MQAKKLRSVVARREHGSDGLVCERENLSDAKAKLV